MTSVNQNREFYAARSACGKHRVDSRSRSSSRKQNVVYEYNVLSFYVRFFKCVRNLDFLFDVVAVVGNVKL